MVTLFLCHFTNPVGEVQRLPKIVEPILLLEMMLVDDRPSPLQLLEQRVRARGPSGVEHRRDMAHTVSSRDRSFVSFHFLHD